MNKQKPILNPKHRTTIGGQALIEGVMMRGPKQIATAVRKPDGDIEIKTQDLNTLAMRYSFFKLPFIRGIVGIIESMIIGTRELMYSASFYEEEETDKKNEGWTQKVFKDKADDVEMAFAVIVSIVLGLGIFMILPSFITNLFKQVSDNHIILNLIEGIIRVLIFLIYVIWISKLEDIRRVFEYHGAEHKSIHCYENDLELTVENVKKFPILHGRCGTSFLFMVMIVSIFVLSFFGWPNPLQRVLVRITMFPVIAGISYEINRIIGRSSSKLCYALSYPGLMVQKLATVREPDDKQIEVAIAALKVVLPESKEEDKW